MMSNPRRPRKRAGTAVRRSYFDPPGIERVRTVNPGVDDGVDGPEPTDERTTDHDRDQP